MSISHDRLSSSTSASPIISSKVSTGPSGIARLRRSVNKEQEQADQMNIDDYILPSSACSPSGLSASPLIEGSGRSGSTVASAIPIKRQRQQQETQQAPLPPQSQPQPQPNLQQRQQQDRSGQDLNQDIQLPYGSAPSQPPRPRVVNEFGYVQRHVRKTSIDERRVCMPSSLMIHLSH